MVIQILVVIYIEVIVGLNSVHNSGVSIIAQSSDVLFGSATWLRSDRCLCRARSGQISVGQFKVQEIGPLGLLFDHPNHRRHCSEWKIVWIGGQCLSLRCRVAESR